MKKILLIFLVLTLCIAARRDHFDIVRLIPQTTPSTGIEGDFVYDDTNNLLKVHNGTSFLTMMDLSTAQTVTGQKTLSGAIGTTSFSLNAQAELRFADSDSSNYTGFKAPSSISTNVIYTMPSASGATNQILKIDGAGVLSWETKIGTGEVTSAMVLDNTLTADDIATSAVTTTEILDGTIASGDLATAINVIKSEQNQLGIEYFVLSDADCASSPCTLSFSSTGVASVTRSATGTYSANFTAAAFASNPLCIVNAGRGGTRLCQVSQPASNCTQTGCVISCVVSSTGAAGDADPHGICIGVR